jgi:hypothetical protein
VAKPGIELPPMRCNGPHPSQARGSPRAVGKGGGPSLDRLQSKSGWCGCGSRFPFRNGFSVRGCREGKVVPGITTQPLISWRDLVLVDVSHFAKSNAEKPSIRQCEGRRSGPEENAHLCSPLRPEANDQGEGLFSNQGVSHCLLCLEGISPSRRSRVPSDAEQSSQMILDPNLYPRRLVHDSSKGSVQCIDQFRIRCRTAIQECLKTSEGSRVVGRCR